MNGARTQAPFWVSYTQYRRESRRVFRIHAVLVLLAASRSCYYSWCCCCCYFCWSVGRYRVVVDVRKPTMRSVWLAFVCMPFSCTLIAIRSHFMYICVCVCDCWYVNIFVYVSVLLHGIFNVILELFFLKLSTQQPFFFFLFRCRVNFFTFRGQFLWYTW